MSQDIQKTGETLPFLLEIGSEEIPARFIPSAMADLERLATAALTEGHLAWAGLTVRATPRRLVLHIAELAVRQPDRDVEIKGPPVSVAFDADEQPTPAGLGFARKAGLDLADCQRGEDQRGEYLVARKVEPGLPAAEVLTQILPGVVLGVPYRKVMRWSNHDLEYPRPLQWILCLMGQDVVPVQVDYLAAGRSTRGHRTLTGNREVEVPDVAAYEAILVDLGIMVDPAARRDVISQGFATLLAGYESGARLLEDEELLTEVVFLCEYPTPFLGKFADAFKALPAEVITTALKAHQRYFTVQNAAGTGLLPRFAAVRDGGDAHLDNVIRGNERVLRARLADALFYWEYDQKKTPDERTDMLATVTWLEGFGSVLDKTGRLTGLTDWLWSHGLGDGGAVPADLTRAARICKSDLVSEMIKDGKEFTKLEGFIGARYAALAGESETVCTAMQRHYFPRTATGDLPGDAVSSTLSVADRLDNLAGCWLAGFVPTGAKDPYALRRHTLAILRILLDRGVNLDLEQALAKALSGFAELADAAARDAALGEISEFIRTRMAGFLTEVLGCNGDVVRAVLPVRWRDPVAAVAWVQALDRYRERADFLQLATGFKRCRNILKGEMLPATELDACRDRWLAGGQGAAGEDFSQLVEETEISLKNEIAGAVAGLTEAEKSGNQDSIFAILSGFGPAIDAFFDNVRVNAEDPALRGLRHAFLREIQGLFGRYADFSEVAPGDK